MMKPSDELAGLADRRKHPRFYGPFDGRRVNAIDTPVKVSDLSRGGCFIVSTHEQQAGLRLTLKIDLPSEGWITLTGETLGRLNQFGFANRFVDVDPDAAVKLERALKRLEGGTAERHVADVVFDGHSPAFSAEPTLDLTVLMPCLNESQTVATCIRKARGCIERLGIAGEVVVADNGSTDGSQRIACAEGARVVNVTERGYGAALYEGTLQSRGRYIIMADADDSYDFSALEPFVTQLRNGANLVMGNRFLGGIDAGAMPWKNRHIGNPALSAIGRLFFRAPVGDFHCGMRGFSRDAFARLQMQTTGMEFASEMVIKATLLGLRIAEVPTTLSKHGRTRPPHLRPWRDGWRHLRFMLLYSPRWLFLYPGLALMTLGVVVGIPLLAGPVRLTSHVAFDVHTLLFAFAAIVLGFQGVAFAICARVYALHEGLLPREPLVERWLKRFTLETGLVVGLLLMILGFGGALAAFVGWSRAGFGPLDSRITLRTAIPAASAMCLGGQIVLTSFLLSFLGLRRR